MQQNIPRWQIGLCHQVVAANALFEHGTVEWGFGEPWWMRQSELR